MNKNKLRNIKALTIVELLIDIVLSSMVMSSVFGLYINYKRTYEFQSDNVFLYQNAKTAHDYLKNDVQIAGFYGCDSTASSIEYAITKTFDYDLSNIVSGYEATGTGLNSSFSLTSPESGWIPATQGQIATVSANAGSDMITIRFADTNALAVLSSDSTGTSLSANGIQSLVKVNDILLVSDCLRTVVFQVGSLGSNSITPTNSVGSLNAGAEIYKINVNSYYIKTVNGIPGLYRLRNGVEELLVPYLENMQLLYGQDTNSDDITDKFNTANNLGTYDIYSISLSVLMRSINKHNQSQTATSFKLFNAPNSLQSTTKITTANDKYLRKSFDFNLNFPNVGGTI